MYVSPHTFLDLMSRVRFANLESITPFSIYLSRFRLANLEGIAIAGGVL